MNLEKNRLKILITGATGFIGSHLANYFSEQGHEVHAIVRRRSNVDVLKEVRSPIKIHTHLGTIESMLRIFKKSRPCLVFHLASHYAHEHTYHELATLLDSNVIFSAQLVEAMALCNVRFLVNTGTFLQHYRTHQYNPVSLYAATKQAFEDILKWYVTSGKIRAITLTLFDVYGPGDRRNKLFSQLLRASSCHHQALRMSPGRQHLDLVHISDVVDAYAVAARNLLALRSPKHARYFISSGRTYSLRRVVELFEKKSNKKLTVIWGGKPYRPREVMKPRNMGRCLPHWKPTVELEDGIQSLM
jgi:nucleoside-diphosphate-sugar epimerase